MGSSSQIIIDLFEVLKIFGGRYYLLYRKSRRRLLAGISRRKMNRRKWRSGLLRPVLLLYSQAAGENSFPTRRRENVRISDSRTCDPAGSGSGQAVSDGDGICRRTGRAAGNCGNGKRQLVRYAGDRADVSRVVNISKLDLGTRNVNGEKVTDCRIGFEWRGGRRILGKIPLQERRQVREEEDRAAWRTGDVVSREIAGKVCRFRCIDDDYQDGRGSYGKRALFLAENVIRSDVDSTYEERILLPFGENNNYKKSRVREWLGNRRRLRFQMHLLYTREL